MVREGRARDAVDDGALLPTAQDDGVDRFLGIRVRERIEPEASASIARAGVMARLGSAPGIRSRTIEQEIFTDVVNTAGP